MISFKALRTDRSSRALKDKSKTDESHDSGAEEPSLLENNASTETIDLDTLLEAELTNSASFDLRFVGQAEFVKLLQAIPVSTLLLDRSGSIVYANLATRKITERYRDLIGTGFTSLFSNREEAGRADVLLQEIFADRRPRIVEGAFQFFDGRIWGRMHLRIVRVKEVHFLIALTEDLTPEKRRLILYEKYKKVVNLLPIGILEFQLSTPLPTNSAGGDVVRSLLRAGVVDGNSEFARLQGEQKAEDLLERTLGEIFPDRAENRLLYTSWIKGGYKISSSETEVVSAKGEIRYLENTFIGQTSKGMLRGFWLLKRDVTARQKIREEAMRAQKIESLGILAGGIAHDFNNLLTAILGNINLAKLASDFEGLAFQRLEEAERGSRQAQALTEQLVTFAKGRVPKKTWVSIVPLIRESVMFALRGSNVKCEFSLPGDLPAVRIDEGQISQVIYNLIINANQALPEGGLIRVGAETVMPDAPNGLPAVTDQYIRIFISDNGLGIPQQNLPRIFDPYFTTKESGSGLGLATSQSIMKGHGGYITVESELSVGTTFSVYLPASDHILPEDSEKPRTHVSGGERILFMDDEKMVRDVTEEMLKHIGYDVQCVEDGRQTLDRYREAMSVGKPFDVVIIDLTVPGGMGGRETVRELLKMDPNVKAVVSTGYSKDPVLQHFESHGFRGAVCKPYDVNQLNALLRQVIHGGT